MDDRIVSDKILKIMKRLQDFGCVALFYSYAPWCPACQSLKPNWNEFAGWSKDIDIQIGAVDITQSPVLTGRCLITALPTIFQ